MASSLGQEWMNLWGDFATERFENLGYKLTFGKNVLEMDEFNSTSVNLRVSDRYYNNLETAKNIPNDFSILPDTLGM